MLLLISQGNTEVLNFRMTIIKLSNPMIIHFQSSLHCAAISSVGDLADFSHSISHFSTAMFAWSLASFSSLIARLSVMFLIMVEVFWSVSHLTSLCQEDMFPHKFAMWSHMVNHPILTPHQSILPLLPVCMFALDRKVSAVSGCCTTIKNAVPIYFWLRVRGLASQHFFAMAL